MPDLSRFEIFELESGILHVRLPFTLSTPYLWIQSSAPGCVSSDMMGVCVCNYEVPPAERSGRDRAARGHPAG
jgi:hypothetical protein